LICVAEFRLEVQWQPITSDPGCAHTTDLTSKRTHVAQVHACDVSNAAQVLGQRKSATSAHILGFNSGEPFDLRGRNFAFKCNMTANHIRPWLGPNNFRKPTDQWAFCSPRGSASSIDSSSVAPEDPLIHQWVSSEVVPVHQNRTGQFLTIRKIE